MIARRGANAVALVAGILSATVAGCQLIGGIERIAAEGTDGAVEGADAADDAEDSEDVSRDSPVVTVELDAAREADSFQAAPLEPPSCAGLAPTCGGKRDCCASNLVPGGTFNRSNDVKAPATVSAFRLDVYEVTVGRFRAFVNAGKGTKAAPPAPGDGAHPKIPMSGWTSAFTEHLATNSAALRTALECNVGYATWTDTPGANETRPMNCVTWFEAFAFCAWDGGRLPTEGEWNYAAAGGSEQRAYPWGATIDPTRAAYECAGDGSEAGACAFADIRPVGSKSPQGDGKWGHADLAGNVWEWALDRYGYGSPYATPCKDCAVLDGAPSTYRVVRGGAYYGSPSDLLSSNRAHPTPLFLADTPGVNYIGLRCARAPVQ